MLGMPKREDDPEGDGPHSMFEDAPIVAMMHLILKLFFGWPLYLTINSTGPLNKRKEKLLSHFNPKTSIFRTSAILGHCYFRCRRCLDDWFVGIYCQDDFYLGCCSLLPHSLFLCEFLARFDYLSPGKKERFTEKVISCHLKF